MLLYFHNEPGAKLVWFDVIRGSSRQYSELTIERDDYETFISLNHQVSQFLSHHGYDTVSGDHIILSGGDRGNAGLTALDAFRASRE